MLGPIKGLREKWHGIDMQMRELIGLLETITEEELREEAKQYAKPMLVRPKPNGDDAA